MQPWTLDLPRTDTLPLLQEIITTGASGDPSSDPSNSTAATTSGGGSGSGGAAPGLAPAHEAAVVALLRRVAAVQRQQLLLTIPFTTIFEYLQHLRAVAAAAAPYGGGCMFYLAAAVSDFYIPWHSLVRCFGAAGCSCLLDVS